MSTKAKDVVETIETSEPLSTLTIIDNAIQRGTDVDVLEKMFSLYERDQARIASQEFDAAMAAFQGQVPAIPRVKKADRYYYAPFEKVMDTIRPFLVQNGLSVRFSTKYEQDGYLTTYCTVAHTSGHKETSEFMCPVDKENKQRINVAQQQGSANSYSKRYALSNALNLAYCDEDDDGEAAGTQYITEEQAADIEALITEHDVNKKLFLKWAKSNSVEEIAAHKFEVCVKRLQEK